MGFGIYVHVPYCLQKCHYCDFVTLPVSHALQPSVYTDLVVREIRSRSKDIGRRTLTSLYFGGGTPSLLPIEQLERIVTEIQKAGFEIAPETEVTLEINPGTIDENSLPQYLSLGINRFSVGAQTFQNEKLSQCGREHSAGDTEKTLRLLCDNDVNFSADLLFGIPHQTLEDLHSDVRTLLKFRPNHVSAYNLTVPKEHFMNSHRPSDSVQTEMFDKLTEWLLSEGIERYEVSNFARGAFQSKHNNLYWSDQPYWGLGISAHSYFPHAGGWGTRFWNPANWKTYADQISANRSAADAFVDQLPASQREQLSKKESLTDYCHTHLRRMCGISLDDVERKYGTDTAAEVRERMLHLANMGLLHQFGDRFFRLSPKGITLANQVFLELTYI